MMDGADFLLVADDLSHGEREADWRSAVSRAYYAAFHVAGELLRQCRFEPPAGDAAHAYLWRRLSNAGHIDVVEAGQKLNHLRGVRNWADYDLRRPLSQTVAFDGVQMATEVIRLLQLLSREEEIRARVTEAMKTYERDVLREQTWHG